MNLPNKITLSRIFLIPFFILFLTPTKATGGEGILSWFYSTKAMYGDVIACGIFLLAACTDGIDGYIARKKNLVTNLGIFLDPIADKLLITSALVILSEKGIVPSWITISIIAREFIITGFRILAADNKIVISANKWGKIKTVSQIIFIAIAIALGNTSSETVLVFINILMTLTTIITVYSGVKYIIDNRSLLKE